MAHLDDLSEDKTPIVGWLDTFDLCYRTALEVIPACRGSSVSSLTLNSVLLLHMHKCYTKVKQTLAQQYHCSSRFIPIAETFAVYENRIARATAIVHFSKTYKFACKPTLHNAVGFEHLFLLL